MITQTIPARRRFTTRVKKKSSADQPSSGPNALARLERSQNRPAARDIQARTPTSNGDGKPRWLFDLPPSLRDCQSLEAVNEWGERQWRVFHRKAEKGLGRRQVPEKLRRTYLSILLRPEATSAAVLSNKELCLTAVRLLHEDLIAIVAANPDVQIGFATIICGSGETSHIRPEVELAGSQAKAKRAFLRLAPNFFAVTELSLFNSHTHPKGGSMIQRHEHALVWGENILEKAKNVSAAPSPTFKSNFTGADIINVKTVDTDVVNLLRVAAYLFKPPACCKTWNPPKDGRRGHMHSGTKGDRPFRYLRLTQLRTLMSLKDATFASGEGSGIRSAIIHSSRALAEAAARPSVRSLHPDEIARFWSDLTKIIAPAWSLPLIRTQI